MMSSTWKKIIFSLLIAVSFSSALNINLVHADPIIDTEEQDENSNKNSMGESNDVRLATSDFLTGAILSFNDEIKKQEIDQEYIKSFANSSVTAIPYGLSLVDWDTIGMFILTLIITFLEMVGMFISLVVLILYNLSSSSFWQTILSQVFDMFDKVLFDWSNPNSWFIRLLVLFGLVAIIKKLLSNLRQVITIKKVISVITQVVISCMLIVFIAQNGRPIVFYIENLATDSISTNFDFLSDQYSNDLPLEINMKNQIFVLMQKQGFVLRHFGVVSSDMIKSINSGSYSNADKDKPIPATGEERVQNMLDNPSTSNAKKERQEYGNDQIGYSTPQCAIILLLSIIFLVHKALLGFIIGSSCLLLLGFTVIKEGSLGVSIYGLVLQLFRKDLRIATSWFMSRLKWVLLAIIVTLVFNMLLSFIIILINYLGARSILLILGFDIVLVLIIRYCIRNWEKIWEKITADFGLKSDSSVIDVGKAIFTGDISPEEVYKNRQNRRTTEKLESEKTDENIDQIDESSSFDDIKDNDDLADIEENNEVADKEIGSENDNENIDTDTEENDTKEFDVEKELENEISEDSTINKIGEDEEGTLDETLNSDDIDEQHDDESYGDVPEDEVLENEIEKENDISTDSDNQIEKEMDEDSKKEIDSFLEDLMFEDPSDEEDN